jgi:hypothetical protein
MLVATLNHSGQVKAALQVAKERVDSGRGGAHDYNEVAWNRLVLGLADADAYEAGKRASQLTEGKNWALLNTHAAVSAAAGHPEEARKLLLETLASRGDERLHASDWLVVGLIAEQYALPGAARSAFQKTVQADAEERAEISAISASVIAKARLPKVEVAPPR